MLPDPILHILRHQHGAIARYQVREVEPSRTARRAIYRDPMLDARTPRVLVHRAAPPGVYQSLMLAVLDAGPDAQLWSKTAACHWGFGRFRLFPPHIAVPRSHRKGERLGQLHVVECPDDRDRATHADIPTARPESTLLWLAGAWTHRYGHDVAAERTAIAVDQAWRQGLVDGRHIHDLAQRSGGRGRSGIVVFRQVLATRPSTYQPAGSRLEERFEEIVSPAVRADLVRQVVVDVEPVIRTVDFRLRRWPLIVEVNGEVFHTSLTDRAADDARYTHLLSLGYSIAVFWEYDIWHDPSIVRATMDSLHRCPDTEPTLHRPTKAPWEW